jgi:hypothetical protein
MIPRSAAINASVRRQQAARRAEAERQKHKQQQAAKPKTVANSTPSAQVIVSEDEPELASKDQVGNDPGGATPTNTNTKHGYAAPPQGSNNMYHVRKDVSRACVRVYPSLLQLIKPPRHAVTNLQLAFQWGGTPQGASIDLEASQVQPQPKHPAVGQACVAASLQRTWLFRCNHAQQVITWQVLVQEFLQAQLHKYDADHSGFLEPQEVSNLMRDLNDGAQQQPQQQQQQCQRAALVQHTGAIITDVTWVLDRPECWPPSKLAHVSGLIHALRDGSVWWPTSTRAHEQQPPCAHSGSSARVQTPCVAWPWCMPGPGAPSLTLVQACSITRRDILASAQCSKSWQLPQQQRLSATLQPRHCHSVGHLAGRVHTTSPMMSKRANGGICVHRYPATCGGGGSCHQRGDNPSSLNL